ncbi:hypothetical protein [Actinokineospora sp. NBRC 105648]|nr:hypothetical protein [Actinokineospora sp. NBRC 105648]
MADRAVTWQDNLGGVVTADLLAVRRGEVGQRVAALVGSPQGYAA